jgi:hypothetical protein
MCNIGKPLEILDVKPLVLPAPLRREKEQPTEQPVTVKILVAEEIPVPEGATVSPVPGTEGIAFPLF